MVAAELTCARSKARLAESEFKYNVTMKINLASPQTKARSTHTHGIFIYGEKEKKGFFSLHSRIAVSASSSPP